MKFAASTIFVTSAHFKNLYGAILAILVSGLLVGCQGDSGSSGGGVDPAHGHDGDEVELVTPHRRGTFNLIKTKKYVSPGGYVVYAKVGGDVATKADESSQLNIKKGIVYDR
jgi:hypothetical protein